jgi:hypothetical protein
MFRFDGKAAISLDIEVTATTIKPFAPYKEAVLSLGEVISIYIDVMSIYIVVISSYREVAPSYIGWLRDMGKSFPHI